MAERHLRVIQAGEPDIAAKPTAAHRPVTPLAAWLTFVNTLRILQGNANGEPAAVRSRLIGQEGSYLAFEVRQPLNWREDLASEMLVDRELFEQHPEEAAQLVHESAMTELAEMQSIERFNRR